MLSESDDEFGGEGDYMESSTSNAAAMQEELNQSKHYYYIILLFIYSFKHRSYRVYLDVCTLLVGNKKHISHTLVLLRLWCRFVYCSI